MILIVGKVLVEYCSVSDSVLYDLLFYVLHLAVLLYGCIVCSNCCLIVFCYILIA